MHLATLIKLTICFAVFYIVLGERCQQSSNVRKSRRKAKLDREYYWTSTYGFPIQKSRWTTNYITEYYSEPQQVWTCCPGYVEKGTNCEPICNIPCPSRASCTAPETCTCSQGYSRTVDGKECVPDCKYGCPLNMYCLSPDQCACRTGYTQKTKDSESANQHIGIGIQGCVPVCIEGCPAHSSCDSPEVCRCKEGYTLSALSGETGSNSSICVPVCTERCPLQASCIGPNRCECAAGYEMLHLPHHRPYCQAQCAQNCSTNGKCVAPDVCECFDGYQHMSDTNASENSLYCQPKCTNGCLHGTCFAPDVCVCDPGYLMGSAGVCEPVCTSSCQHGRCVDPEICACDEGYRHSVDDYSKCEPICPKACVNADCAAPDICLCRDKYKPKLDASSGLLSSNECEPMCTPECEQADCVAPDVCHCHLGYQPNENATEAYICQPACERGCEHGSCIAPNVCICAEGFELDSNGELKKCVPFSTTYLTTEATTDATTTQMPINTDIMPSTIFTDDWFTKGLIAEALTTIAESHAAITLTTENLEKCTGVCYCWKEDEAGQCLEICGMVNDACIEPKFVRCNEEDRQIVYTDGEIKINYFCGANKTALPDSQKNVAGEPMWLLISAPIFIIIMLIGIVYFCVRIYQTRHHTGSHDIPINLLMKL